MNRRLLRRLLTGLLVLSVAFAAWCWFRPYDWNPDPGARCKVEGVRVTRDRSFFWVDVHLTTNPGEAHDLMRPVRLLTRGGRELEPADSTFGQDDGGDVRDLWFRFWLETQDLEGPLTLRLNDGTLRLKAGNGIPSLTDTEPRYFTSHRW